MPYARTRLGRWFYEERGVARKKGDAAIVMWPSLLFDGGMWREQVEPLAALGRVIVFDPPGHGKSEVPPPFSLEDNADALLDAFGELRSTARSSWASRGAAWWGCAWRSSTPRA